MALLRELAQAPNGHLEMVDHLADLGYGFVDRLVEAEQTSE